MIKAQTPALITHTAASAGANGVEQNAGASKGVMLFVDITAITGTSPTLTVTLQGRSPTGLYYTILASAALAATGLTVLRVYPGLTAATNTIANDVLPEAYRVITAIGGTGPAVTATVHALLVE